MAVDGYTNPDLLTEEELGQLFKLPVKAIQLLYKNGELPTCVLLGKHRRWLREDLIRFVNRLARESRDKFTGHFERVAAGEEKNRPVGRTYALPPLLQRIQERLVEESSEPAVYFLMKNGAVVYVGLSVRPMKRIGEHRTGNGSTVAKDFDHALFLPTSMYELIETERFFIKALDPPLNTALRPCDSEARQLMEAISSTFLFAPPAVEK